MSKLKVIGFIVFVAASLAAATWGYLHLKNTRKPVSNPLAHFPKDPLCVIQSANFKELVNKLTHQNLVWKALDSTLVVSEANKNLQYIEALLAANEKVAQLVNDNDLFLAFYKRGKDTEHLLAFGLREHGDEAVLDDYFEAGLKKLSSADGIFLLPLSATKTWYLQRKEAVVLLSSDLDLLQRGESDVASSLAGNADYMGLKEMDNADFFKVYFPEHSVLFNPDLLSGACMFDVETDPYAINLTGYIKPSKNSFLQKLSNRRAAVISCFDYLPRSTMQFSATLLDAPASYFETNLEPLAQAQWKRLNDSAMYDIRHELAESLQGELVSALYVNNDGQARELRLLKIAGDGKLDNVLKLVADSITVLPVNGAGVNLIRLKQAYSNVFGTLKEATEPALCSDGNYLVLCASMADARAYLAGLNASSTLAKTPDFMAFAEDNLLHEANFVYYENPALLMQFGVAGLVQWSGFTTHQNKMAHICLTATNARQAVSLRMNVQYKQSRSAESDQAYLWMLRADTLIRTPAYPFKNHVSGENELLFQDESNALSLVNATGSLLWKKKINEPIRSQIYTVDLFKNKRYQIFFNTDNYLHLIDRNGNYVQGYPVRLPARATAPLTLLDYGGNRDYRIFVSCADKRIYNYTMYGIRNEGFHPVRTDEVVQLPVQYVSVGGSDFLVTADRSGKIYVFSRKGDGRIDFKKKAVPGLGSFYVDAGKTIQSTRFVYVDPAENLLCKISFDDKKETVKLDNDIANFESAYALVNDDRQTDLILYGAGGLFAYDFFGSKLMEHFSTSAVYNGVAYNETQEDACFAAYDKAGAKTDLVAPDGSLKTSLSGSSQRPLLYNLFRDNRFYLVLVDNKTLKCTK